jgi:hypothetical protein
MFTNNRLLLCGIGIWVIATAALRVAGQRLLPPGDGKGTG